MPEAGTELKIDGSAAGQITSAAELQLSDGRRVFALGMMRADAEASNQPLTYTAGTAVGDARILATPPNL